MTEGCASCRYSFVRRESDFLTSPSSSDVRRCRRLPPAIGQAGFDFGARSASFPRVQDDDWCGEYALLHPREIAA